MTMSIGLVGKKCGMTRIFTPAGESIPVTLIEATPNRITSCRTRAGSPSAFAASTMLRPRSRYSG